MIIGLTVSGTKFDLVLRLVENTCGGGGTTSSTMTSTTVRKKTPSKPRKPSTKRCNIDTIRERIVKKCAKNMGSSGQAYRIQCC